MVEFHGTLIARKWTNSRLVLWIFLSLLIRLATSTSIPLQVSLASFDVDEALFDMNEMQNSFDYYSVDDGADQDSLNYNADKELLTRIPSFQARSLFKKMGSSFKKVGTSVKSVNWKKVGNVIRDQGKEFVKSQVSAAKNVASSAKTFGKGFVSGGAGVISSLKKGDIKGAMKKAGTAMKNNAMNGLKLTTSVATFVRLSFPFLSSNLSFIL